MLRGEVWEVLLNPTRGSEQKGLRPAVIISPNSMNSSLETKVIIPLTTKPKTWSSRVDIKFKHKNGQAMCEQIKTISAKRLVSHKGKVSDSELVEILSTIKSLYGEV